MNHREEDDPFEEDIVFDQAGLLSTSRKSGKSAIRRVSSGKCATFSKTLGLCGAFLGLGLTCAIPGPLSPIPPNELSDDISLMSPEIMFRCLGFMIGAMFGARLLDRFNRLFLVFLALLVTALLVTIIPWCGIVWLLRTDMFLLGGTIGFLSTGGNVLCLDLWGRNSGPFMQALQFSFSLGVFLAPLLSQPLINPTVNTPLVPSTTPAMFPLHRIPRSLNTSSFNFTEGDAPVLHTENFTRLPPLGEEVSTLSKPILNLTLIDAALHGNSITSSTSKLPTAYTKTTSLSSPPPLSSTPSSITTAGLLFKDGLSTLSTHILQKNLSYTNVDSISTTHRVPKPKPELTNSDKLKDKNWENDRFRKPPPEDLVPVSTTMKTTTHPAHAVSFGSLSPLKNSTVFVSATKPNVNPDVKNTTLGNNETSSKNETSESRAVSSSNATLQAKRVGVAVNSTKLLNRTSSFSSTTISPLYSSTSHSHVQAETASVSSSNVITVAPLSSTSSPIPQTSSTPLVSTSSPSPHGTSSPTVAVLSQTKNGSEGNDKATTLNIYGHEGLVLKSLSLLGNNGKPGGNTTANLTESADHLPSRLTSTEIPLHGMAERLHDAHPSNPAVLQPQPVRVTEHANSSVAVSRNDSTTSVPVSSRSFQPLSRSTFTTAASTRRTHHSKPGSTVVNDTEVTHTVIGAFANRLEKYGLSKMQLMYLVVGMVLLATSLLFLAFLCFNPRDPKSKTDEEDASGPGPRVRTRGASRQASTPQPAPRWLRNTLLALMLVMLMITSGVQAMYGQLLLVFATQSSLQLSQSTGSALTATFWGALTSSRFACILLASALSPTAMLVLSVALCSCATWLLSALASSSEVALWVGSVMVGVGTASVFPSGLLWLQRYLVVTHRVAAMLVMGPAMAEMLLPTLAYRMMGGVGPASLLHLPALLSLCTIALWTAAWRLARHPRWAACAQGDSGASGYQLANQNDEDDLLDLTMSPVINGGGSVSRSASSHCHANGFHRLSS